MSILDWSLGFEVATWVSEKRVGVDGQTNIPSFIVCSTFGNLMDLVRGIGAGSAESSFCCEKAYILEFSFCLVWSDIFPVVSALGAGVYPPTNVFSPPPWVLCELNTWSSGDCDHRSTDS